MWSNLQPQLRTIFFTNDRGQRTQVNKDRDEFNFKLTKDFSSMSGLALCRPREVKRPWIEDYGTGGKRRERTERFYLLL